MIEHLTEDESFCLIFVGIIAPMLIFGGLVAVFVGIFRELATDSLINTVIGGGVAFGAGGGMLGALGFYHWHRSLVESQRDRAKTPIDVNDWSEE